MVTNPFLSIETKLEKIEAMLLELQDHTTPVEVNKNELLTIDEVCDILKCSKPTLYAKHSRNELPGVSKVGKRLLFNRQVLLEWIASTESKTTKQIQQEARLKLIAKKGGAK